MGGNLFVALSRVRNVSSDRLDGPVTPSADRDLAADAESRIRPQPSASDADIERLADALARALAGYWRHRQRRNEEAPRVRGAEGGR